MRQPRQLPFIGREAELRAVIDTLSDSNGSVIVAGPPGVGKTRLVDEALGRLPEAPARRVRATRTGASLPWLALAPLLGDETPHTPLDAVHRIKVALGDGSLLLVVDDLQWLDSESAAVVHLAVADGWIALLGTQRTGEPAPEPVLTLWKDDLVTRFDLAPLDREATAELAAAVVGGVLDGHAREAVWAATKGNPLHIREWVHAVTASGALVDQGGGVFMLRAQPSAPDRLVELVESHLSGLAAEPRAVLEVLGVTDALPLATLAELCGDAAVAAAERSGFVVVDDGTATVSLAHPLFADALRSMIPPVRRAQLQEQIAERLVAGEPSPRERVAATVLRLTAGATVPVDELLEMAKLASRTGDQATATRLAEAARAAGGGAPALHELGVYALRAGRGDEAEAMLGEAMAEGSPEERAALIRPRAHNLVMNLGRADDAIALVVDGAAALPEPERPLLLAKCAMIWVLAGRCREALEHIGAVEPPTDMDTVVMSWAGALANALLGRADGAQLWVEMGEERLARTPGGNRLPEGILAYAALAETDAGRFAEAEEALRRTYAAAISSGDREDQATATLIGGRLALARGLVTDASASFREGSAANHQLGDRTGLRWTLAGQALAASWLGDAEAAAESLAELRSLPATSVVLDADLAGRAEAWGAVVRHEHARAIDLFQRAADDARAAEQVAAEMWLRHDAARLGAADRVAGRLEALAVEMDGELPGALARHAAALAARDGHALDEAAEELAAIGAMLLAAEAAAEAARIHSTGALRRAAAASANRSAAWAERCQGARTPALGQSEPVSPLTAREREIASLAAGGLASKEIAARLFLSPRTVDNHLQAVFAKLGVSNRRGLAARMG